MFSLKPDHKGDYSCTASNFLGIERASSPTIVFNGENKCASVVVINWCRVFIKVN